MCLGHRTAHAWERAGPHDSFLVRVLRHGRRAKLDWATAGALSGSTESYTATVPYGGDTVYFALKSQNAGGSWSDLSNNAFWPHWDAFLPLVTKAR